MHIRVYICKIYVYRYMCIHEWIYIYINVVRGFEQSLDLPSSIKLVVYASIVLAVCQTPC